jgi:hypothetical protein
MKSNQRYERLIGDFVPGIKLMAYPPPPRHSKMILGQTMAARLGKVECMRGQGRGNQGVPTHYAQGGRSGRG